MKKIKVLFVLLLVLLAVSMSTVCFAVIEGIDPMDFSGDAQKASGSVLDPTTFSGDAKGAADSIMDVSNSVFDTVQTIGNSFAIVIIGLVISLIFILVRKIVRKEDLEKCVKNAKTNVIVVIILYAFGLILYLFNIFINSSSVTISEIVEIIFKLIIIILLILSFKKYKKGQILEAAEFEKITAVILILNLVITYIAVMIFFFASGLSNMIPNLFGSSIVIKYLFIPLFLLFDSIKIARQLKEEQNLTKSPNIIAYVICFIGVIIYVILAMIPVVNKYKPLIELMKQYNSTFNNGVDNTVINNDEKNLYSNIQSWEDKYQQSVEKEGEILNSIFSNVEQPTYETNTINNELYGNNISNNSINNNYSNSINLPEKIDNSGFNNNEEEKIKGDANGDGKVTMTDLALINNYYVTKDETNIANIDLIDINGDGKITITDIAKVKQKIVGLE